MNSSKDRAREKLMARYRSLLETQGDTLGRLLQKALNSSIDQLLNPNPFADFDLELSPAQSQLLQLLCLMGSNATDLAKRLSISKQAVGQMVAELEALGLVEKSIDPSDTRARLIQHTEKGYQLVTKLLERTIEMEDYYSKLFGQKKFTEFKKLLNKIGESE